MTTVIPLLPQVYSERLQRREDSSLSELWDILDQVKDPEIPVISIWDLGVLSDIEKTDDGILVIITPTYSGCPAMDVIRSDIDSALRTAGVENFRIKTNLSPAWSTDMMSPEGKVSLQDYGIAPPQQSCGSVICPHCKSVNTRKISEFGSTACKALYQCNDCSEPFDYFKNI